jgi:hypothetical protein
MARQIRIWWQSAVALANGLTVPRPDVPASDRAVEMVLRDSRLFGLLDAADASGRRAWPHSRSRSWWLRIAAGWAALSGPGQVRAAGVVAMVGGLTAILAQAAKPVSIGPLIWVLPAVVACLGLLAALAAGPLARAIADKAS